MINYIEKQNIIYQCQFGFRKGYSTSLAITEITNNLRKAIDSNIYTCGVFLDFSKAFDTVNHKILLDKLEMYGIRGVPLKWFASYLTDRKQYVDLGGVKSTEQTMLCGIPQGSTLGPLMFLIYINDLPNSSDKLSFKIFADDTNVFASSGDLRTLENLINVELVKVKNWCHANKLSLNMSKTNFMLIKSPRKKDSIINVKLMNCDGSFQLLERKTCIKYLGVLIDEHLTWKDQISFIRSRISRNTGIISKLRHFLSIKQLKQIYYNLIYPYISYGILAWGSTFKTYLNTLQTKQNHIVRLMFFTCTHGKETEKAKPLLNLLDMLTVDNVYQLHALKFVHSWHKGLLPEIFHDTFQYASSVHNYNTRYAAKQNLYKSKVRTNIGKQSVSFLGSDIWRQLPSSLKDSSTSAFPKLAKHHLLYLQEQTG